MAGILLLAVYAIYFISKKYAEKGAALWLTGLVVALLAFWQIGQGMLEEHVHETYILGAAKFGGLGFIMQFLFIAIGFVVRLWQTRLWRGLLGKNQEFTIGD